MHRAPIPSIGAAPPTASSGWRLAARLSSSGWAVRAPRSSAMTLSNTRFPLARAMTTWRRTRSATVRRVAASSAAGTSMCGRASWRSWEE
ncbi:hypothetical protein BLSMQ_0093 [Brevibacterium aurantiacum]|uniref:Uncharacterized protein n=1 Tax=Brevibacterium aurantiacum TaxID=273384 RepID=A0A1D7VYF6_BREAU|nr:hypothetical protein BLSMQ_0093 [Brevibacterium aurantiacum]